MMGRGLALGFALLLAGLACLAQAQPRLGGFPPGVFQSRAAIDGGGGFTPSCTESTNFLARTSGLDTTHKTNYDNLICGLVTDGDYTKLDVLYVWATDTTTNALLDLTPNARNGTVIGTPASFTANVGYTGDGSTFAIDSGFNPFSASTPQYTLDSASVGVYVQSNFTSGFHGIWNAGAENVGIMHFTTYFFDTAQYVINGTIPKIGVTSTTSLGQWILTRTASTTVAFYRNGSTTPFDTDTDVSSSVPRTSIYFFDANGNSAAISAQMSGGFIGGGLTSAAMARVAARNNAYMTAYGINVY